MSGLLFKRSYLREKIHIINLLNYYNRTTQILRIKVSTLNIVFIDIY